MVAITALQASALNSDFNDDIDWWPMLQHDPNHKGYSSSTAPSEGDLLWYFATNNFPITSSPIVFNYVYLGGGYDDTFYCLYPENGSIKWQYIATGAIRKSPCVSNENVYFYSDIEDFPYGSRLYCLEAETGDYVWSKDYSVSERIGSSITASYGNIYFGVSASNSGIKCVNATDGSTAWFFRTNADHVYGTPAISDGKVYVGTFNDHILYCLDAFDGSLIWSCETNDRMEYAPTITNDRVFISVHSSFYCFDATPEDGIDEGLPDPAGSSYDIIWADSTVIMGTSAAVAYNKLYVGSSTGVRCLNAKNGNLIWNHLSGSVHSSPAIADEKIYFGADDDNVYCLNALNGSVIWNYTTDGITYDFVSSPAIADGKIFIGSRGRNFYCFYDQSYLTAEIESSTTQVQQNRYFGFNITITNNLGIYQRFEIWTAFQRQTSYPGQIYKAKGPFLITLAPFETKTYNDIIQWIGNQHLGNYRYYFQVGFYPNNVFSEDYLQIEIVR